MEPTHSPVHAFIGHAVAYLSLRLACCQHTTAYNYMYECFDRVRKLKIPRERVCVWYVWALGVERITFQIICDHITLHKTFMVVRFSCIHTCRVEKKAKHV